MLQGAPQLRPLPWLGIRPTVRAAAVAVAPPCNGKVWCHGPLLQRLGTDRAWWPIARSKVHWVHWFRKMRSWDGMVQVHFISGSQLWKNVHVYIRIVELEQGSPYESFDPSYWCLISLHRLQDAWIKFDCYGLFACSYPRNQPHLGKYTTDGLEWIYFPALSLPVE